MKLEQTTTTEPAPEETAEETSQAESTVEPAEESTTQTQPDQETGKVDDGNEPDEVNLEWLSKTKGVDVNDPKAVAEAWRKAEQEFHKSRQETKSLQESLGKSSSESEIDPDMASFRKELAESRFYRTYPDAEGHETELGQVAKDYPHLRDLYAGGYSAETSVQALKAMWEIHLGRTASGQLKDAEVKGREAAKTEIARSSAAQSPRGGASAGIPAKTPDQERLEKFSKWD